MAIPRSHLRRRNDSGRNVLTMDPAADVLLAMYTRGARQTCGLAPPWSGLAGTLLQLGARVTAVERRTADLVASLTATTGRAHDERCRARSGEHPPCPRRPIRREEHDE